MIKYSIKNPSFSQSFLAFYACRWGTEEDVFPEEALDILEEALSYDDPNVQLNAAWSLQWRRREVSLEFFRTSKSDKAKSMLRAVEDNPSGKYKSKYKFNCIKVQYSQRIFSREFLYCSFASSCRFISINKRTKELRCHSKALPRKFIGSISPRSNLVDASLKFHNALLSNVII